MKRKRAQTEAKFTGSNSGPKNQEAPELKLWLTKILMPEMP